MKTFFTLPCFAVLIFSTFSWAAPELNYHQLALKDLDQMNALVLSKIRASKKSETDKITPLQSAYFSIFSRPDDDSLIEKIYPLLRSEMDENEVKDSISEAAIDEALSHLKNPEKIKADLQVTYWVLLENILADLKSNLTDRESTEFKLIKKVEDAKIQISKKAISERKLRMMRSADSPSLIAKRIRTKFESNHKKTKDADKKSDK